MKPKIVFALLLPTLTGCAGVEFVTDRYSMYGENIVALSAHDSASVSVGEFSTGFERPTRIYGKIVSETGHSEIRCRTDGLIRPADGQTFAEFLRNAMIGELANADIYAEQASTVLTGTLDGVETSWINPIGFASFGGTWKIELTVHSSNGNSLSATITHSYETQYQGSSCVELAEAFVPTVQSLLLKLFNHENFPSLIR